MTYPTLPSPDCLTSLQRARCEEGLGTCTSLFPPFPRPSTSPCALPSSAWIGLTFLNPWSLLPWGRAACCPKHPDKMRTGRGPARFYSASPLLAPARRRPSPRASMVWRLLHPRSFQFLGKGLQLSCPASCCHLPPFCPRHVHPSRPFPTITYLQQPFSSFSTLPQFLCILSSAQPASQVAGPTTPTAPPGNPGIPRTSWQLEMRIV